MTNIKQINVSSATYDIEALHFVSGSLDTPAQWKAYIDEIAKLGFKIEVLASLPEATEANYNKYKQSIVLVPDATAIAGAYEEYVILDKGSSASPRYVWEKIGSTQTDLSAYAKKVDAGKAGTYTTTGTALATESAGSSAQAVTISGILYKKANDIASSGAHTHSVSASGSYKPAGAISEATTGTANYTPKGTVSAVTAASHSHVVNVSKETSTVVTSVATSTGEASATTPTTTGNAGAMTLSHSFAGKTATLSQTIDYQPAGSVASHSHTITSATDSVNSITSAGTLPTLTITTRKVPVTTLTTTISVVTGVTAASLTGDITFVKNYPNFSGGSLSGATTFVTSIKTNASVGGTKNYGFAASQANIMTAPTVSAEGVLSWTAVTAGTQDGHSVTQMTFNTDSVGLTPAYLGTAETGTVQITGGTASGKASFAPTDIGSASGWNPGSTPSYTAKTVIKSVDANTGNTKPDFTGTTATLGVSIEYQPEGTIGNHTISAHSHSYDKAINHSHSIAPAGTTAISYVASATTGLAGAINVTPEFTGTGAVLAFNGTSATINVSGNITSSGAHTHAVTFTDTAVSGSATVNTAHTHSINSHTHNVTINNCA